MDKSLNRPQRRTEHVKIRGETFDLLPERCAFRRSTKTLLAADLHWGKSETFQSYGLAVPSDVIEDDLRRLSSAIELTGAETLLILGDLIHTPRGVTDKVSARIEDWRARHPNLTFQVIRGNHDRRFPWPEAWGIEEIGTELRDRKFLFTHDEPAADQDDERREGSPSDRNDERSPYLWMGHVHPVVELRGAGDRLRLPCFVVEENFALLPAFSAFTGGASIGDRAEGKRIFAIADTAVIEV
jgi:metallophosphoesterase superfamily enzyme